MRLGKTKSSGFNPACLIHFWTASRVACVISNCTGRWVLCCITTARVATWSPWQTSRTLRLTRSQQRDGGREPAAFGGLMLIVRRLLLRRYGGNEEPGVEVLARPHARRRDFASTACGCRGHGA